MRSSAMPRWYVATALAALAACSSGVSPDVLPAERSNGPCIQPGPVAFAPSSFTLTADVPPTARAGAPVRFRLLAVNTGPARAIIETGDSATTFNFAVLRASDGRRVWDRIAAGLVRESLEGFPVDPGDTLAFPHVWDGRDYRGQRLPPGVYQAFAVLELGRNSRPADGSRCWRSALLPLTLRP